VIAGALMALVAASPAAAMKTVETATPTVQRWTSPNAYDAPYALVRVIHDGESLSRMPITRCKGTYASKDLAVMISTCGDRWRVRANFVSMSAKRERFTIVYEPRAKP
jgi:hypothetical protein